MSGRVLVAQYRRAPTKALIPLQQLGRHVARILAQRVSYVLRQLVGGRDEFGARLRGAEWEVGGDMVLRT